MVNMKNTMIITMTDTGISKSRLDSFFDGDSDHCRLPWPRSQSNTRPVPYFASRNIVEYFSVRLNYVRLRHKSLPACVKKQTLYGSPGTPDHSSAVYTAEKHRIRYEPQSFVTNYFSLQNPPREAIKIHDRRGSRRSRTTISAQRSP